MCYKLSLGVKLTLVALFLFLQSFSQNVGIGTTNPIEKLQVAGNLHVDGNVRAQGRYYYFGAKQFLHGDNSSVLQFRSANPLYTQFHFRDSTGRFYGKLLGYNGGDLFGMYDANNKPFFQSKLDTYLRFLVGNSEKVRIETTGDVGIGTTNPLYRLDIFDPGQAMLRLRSSSDHTILQLRTVAAKGNYLRFNRDGNSSFWLYNTPTNDLQFRPLGGTASVIFKENGFVGIGTTSPTNMLDVNGAARVRTLTAGNAADQVVVADANGVLRKLPASGLGLEDHDWYGVGTTAAPTSINDNIFTQGDVGIGIANPLEKLHVQGNMRLDGRVIYFGGTQRIIGDDFSGLYYDANHSTVTQMIFRDKEYTRYGAVTGSGNGVRFGLLDGDANWAIRLEKDLWTGFNINNVEKMRILDNGNVGIGTSTPANSIHTIGNIRADGRKYYFGATQNLTGDDGSAIAFNGNHSTISQFKVRDKEGKLYGILYGSGDGVRFGLLDGDGNWSYRAEKDLWTGFNINNSEKMRILANGHVGIGTMTPESRLHVKNTGTSLLKVESTTNSTILEMETVSGKANSFRFLRNGAASFYINNTNANDLHFRPLGNATPSVSFTANGRVGVGKNSPCYFYSYCRKYKS